MATGDLTERALANILAEADTSSIIRENEELREAEEERIRQTKRSEELLVGEENYGLLARTRAKTARRVAGATADTPLEQLEDFQKQIGKIQARRPTLGYRPPTFTRGTPKAPATPQVELLKTVQTILNDLEKNIELPTEEATDA
tara:strand:+ start:485 stop:919 length:435 start_codon:yes stop_codon:yes gene_type:complete